LNLKRPTTNSRSLLQKGPIKEPSLRSTRLISGGGDD